MLIINTNSHGDREKPGDMAWIFLVQIPLKENQFLKSYLDSEHWGLSGFWALRHFVHSSLYFNLLINFRPVYFMQSEFYLLLIHLINSSENYWYTGVYAVSTYGILKIPVISLQYFKYGVIWERKVNQLKKRKTSCTKIYLLILLSYRIVLILKVFQKSLFFI